MLAWLNSKLTPEWRSWWKLRSIQVGVLFTAIIAYLAANPDAWTKFVAWLPPAIANTIPAWVGTLAAAVIFFARFWKQSGADITRAAQDPTLGNLSTAAADIKAAQPPQSVVSVIEQAKADNGNGTR